MIHDPIPARLIPQLYAGVCGDGLTYGCEFLEAITAADYQCPKNCRWGLHELMKVQMAREDSKTDQGLGAEAKPEEGEGLVLSFPGHS